MVRVRDLVALGLAIAGLMVASSAASSDQPGEPEDVGVSPPSLSAESDVSESSEASDGECDPLFDDECEAGAHGGFPDPWEPYNRGVLAFNNGFDLFVLNPITFVYKTLLPDPVERAFLRLVDNLDSPSIMINDGLQLEWRDATVTLERFLLNTTVGLAGLFDPASALGLEHHHSDFGQTLTLAGVSSGPYMILPVLGPTTVRDGSGIMADVAMSPLLYVLGPLTFEVWRQGGSGLATRADVMRDLQTLEKESIDFYAALRSAFYQNRQAQIWAGREHRRPSSDPS